jgi:lysine-specific demethylase/histidyl-hydroxylase NO66
MTPETFMEEYWEKKAVLIRREDAHYYKDFFSSKMFAEMIDRNPLEFGVNLDVTTWDKKQGRQTHNEIGRAYPPKIWDYFNNGCSVRMKNPQTYSNTIWKVCAGLQEFFGCFTGANTYLTPPASQGEFKIGFDVFKNFPSQRV